MQASSPRQLSCTLGLSINCCCQEAYLTVVAELCRRAQTPSQNVAGPYSEMVCYNFLFRLIRPKGATRPVPAGTATVDAMHYRAPPNLFARTSGGRSSQTHRARQFLSRDRAPTPAENAIKGANPRCSCARRHVLSNADKGASMFDTLAHGQLAK
jgi:hypothetical protein